MLDHSPEFAAAALDPDAVVVSRVDVLVEGRTVLTGIPAEVSISPDRSQFVRRTASLTLPGSYTDDNGVFHDLTPNGTVADILSPFGNELRVFIGFHHPLPAPELLCQGTFVIWSADVDELGDVTVAAYDRSKRVQEQRFPFPYRVGDGVSAIGVLRSLLLDVVPWGDVRVAAGVQDVQVDGQVFQENRDEAVSEVAASLGCEVFADVWGTFVVQPIPDPYGTPVLTLSTADLLITGRRSVSRDGVYNGIVARGQSTGSTPPPMSKLVKNEDPASPTRWGGPFGEVVGFLDSSLFTTVAQAQAAAEAQVRDLVGRLLSVEFTMVPHYALEPGDLVRLDVAAVANQHMIEQLQITTDPGAVQSGNTRAVTVGDVT